MALVICCVNSYTFKAKCVFMFYKIIMFNIVCSSVTTKLTNCISLTERVLCIVHVQFGEWLVTFVLNISKNCKFFINVLKHIYDQGMVHP